MDKIEQQRDHFENISEKYYKSRQLKNHLLLKDLLWDFFLKDKDFLKKDGLRVLEPMCGYGEGKKILEKNLGIKIAYSGFDYSSNLVEKIKKLDPAAEFLSAERIRKRTYKKNELFDNDTERAFELKKINQIFIEHNFKIIDQIYPGLLSYVLYFNPDAFPFLNRGGGWLVRAIFNFDKLFFRNFIGKKLSFATIALLQKNENK